MPATPGSRCSLGRSIDLVGTELPYQPFVEALRPLGEPRQADRRRRARSCGCSRRRSRCSPSAPPPRPCCSCSRICTGPIRSTLDLVVFLAHNLDDRPVLLLATYRADEPSSAERMRRLADGVRRSGSALVLELGPLEHDELTALLAAHVDAPLPAALADAIVARSEGNPFFAEELLAAAGDESGELPRGLRDLLLQRVARLDRPTQSLLRAGRGRRTRRRVPVALRDWRRCPEPTCASRCAGRSSTASSSPSRATAASASATRCWRRRSTRRSCPASARSCTRRLADELARSGAATPAELAPHWAAAGRSTEALAASVEAAREAEAVFGLAEALAHLERALALWHAVPDAAELAGLDLAELCTRTAELASQIGAAPRAVELGRRAIELVGEGDPHRAALLHVRLGEYLEQTGSEDACLAAVERAVELVPAEPPSPERAYALAVARGGLAVAWRHAESLPICEQALALARDVGAREAEVRALTVLGSDLAYLGRGEEGVADLRQALQLAEEIGDHIGLERACVHLTDVLTMLGRLRESARLGQEGLEVMRRYGIDSPLLVSNQIEALVAIGDWDEADRLSAAALRGITSSFPYWLLIDPRRRRDRPRRARRRASAPRGGGRHPARGPRARPLRRLSSQSSPSGSAAGRTRTRPSTTGLARARPREAAQIRVQLCAKGLRAQAELAALARARRDADAVRDRLGRARKLHRRRSARRSRGRGGHAERRRLAARWPRPSTSAPAASRGPSRGRRRQRLGAARAPAPRGLLPLAPGRGARRRRRLPHRGGRAAPGGARRRGSDRSKAPARASSSCSPNARGSISRRPRRRRPTRRRAWRRLLGLTPREAEVLTLVARGYTNREIAAALVISVKTASVHVSHILRKLDAPNRLEAAAIAHRLAPPDVEPPNLGA